MFIRVLFVIILFPFSAFGQYPYDLYKNDLKLPRVYDESLSQILSSPNTIYYKLPMAWQHYTPGVVWDGFYYEPYLDFFNANKFFPWETTFGLNAYEKISKGNNKKIYNTINFVALPSQKNGRPYPILIFNETPLKWIFPTETMVGEILYVEYDSIKYIQEIRTRTKSKDSKTWIPNIYRPIKNKKELCSILGIEYESAYLYESFRNPQEDEVFQADGLIERLPKLTEEQTKQILKTPFKSVLDGDNVWSPASDQDFNILPKNYNLELLGSVDKVSCANCHRQTQISVRNLIPKEPEIINNPEKVGNIRGSDGVFSWYPIHSVSIRNNKKQFRPKLYLRDYDVKQGFVKEVPSNMEWTTDRYKLTLFVQESLKDYELPSRKELLHE